MLPWGRTDCIGGGAERAIDWVDVSEMAQVRHIPSADRLDKYGWLRKLPKLLFFLAAGLLVGGMAIMVFYQVSYSAKIYPGVYVRSQKLGGLTRARAEEKLMAHFASLNTSPWTLRDGEQTWQVSPGALGVRIDLPATVDAAYAVGRDGSLTWNLGRRISAWWQDVHISPVVQYDETTARQFLLGLADQIDRPTIDAALRLDGTLVYETKSQVGRRLDVEATMALLREAADDLQPADIPLVIVQTQPRVVDASLARQQAEAIVAQPLTLYVEESQPVASGEEEGDKEEIVETPGPWVLSPQELADMLIIDQDPAGDGAQVRLTVSLDEQALGAYLAPLADGLSRTAKNARFIFNDDTHLLEVISPGVDGRELDVEGTVERIKQAAWGEERRVPLAFDITRAEFHNDVTGEELGITELIASSTSYYAGSSAGRINNVAVAASKFHGLIIKPGETFSFSEHLGDVSEEEGYDESLIIFGNETIREVGGGICQVSTTLFRTAFWAGYPITERWAHAYRVGYYEQGGLPIGTDATIYAPLVDLKFLNDTPHHLLIEAYPYSAGTQLTFKFYSTKVGRTVEMIGPEVTDVVEHGEPIYKEDPELVQGEIKQVEWAVNGATVKVTRVVRDSQGNELERKDFKSKYRPWDAVYLVGPGTEIPGVDIVRLDEQEDEE